MEMTPINTSSLLKIQSQIVALQKRASQLRTKQYKNALKKVVSLIKEFGITINEVKEATTDPSQRARPGKMAKKTGRPAKRAAKRTSGNTSRKVKSPKGSRRPAPVKYKGPSGETWSGRGKQPVWLRTQIDSGRKLEDFKV